ncbi:MAG: kinase [Candidatus Aminicenantes bacterium]|nr:kinase [Candidatus Aminicenantes bacterium]
MTGFTDRPFKMIHARAPLRINDIGGWTDTWFAREGWVLNMAIAPPVEVQVKAFENRGSRGKRVLLHTENYGESFRVDPDRPATSPHPLLQHIVARLRPPENLRLEVNLFSPSAERHPGPDLRSHRRGVLYPHAPLSREPGRKINL